MTQRIPQEINHSPVPVYLMLHQAAPLAAAPPLGRSLADMCWRELPATLACFADDSPVPRPAATRAARLPHHAGRIDGMIFLGSPIIDLPFPAIAWTRDWIARVGDQPLA